MSDTTFEYLKDRLLCIVNGTENIYKIKTKQRTTGTAFSGLNDVNEMKNTK